jgi:hypothetical protein
MQPNTITLAVDIANSGSTTNEVYNRYEETQNRTTYIGSGHTPDSRDSLTLYRTQPTRTGNFKGVAKSAVKFTDDVEVSGVDSSTTLAAPMILEISFSIPVGTAATDVKHLRQRALAALDDDSVMDALNIQLMV